MFESVRFISQKEAESLIPQESQILISISCKRQNKPILDRWNEKDILRLYFDDVSYEMYLNNSVKNRKRFPKAISMDNNNLPSF